jgi:DNA helicase-2/ATP-dependent DNA helicase PcrA
MTDINLKEEYFKLRDEIILREFRNLDEQQREAVLSHNRNTLVLACPGSGKTTVLIHKVLYLAKYGPVYKSSQTPDNLNFEDIRVLREFLSDKSIAEGNLMRNRIEKLLYFGRIDYRNIIVITFTKAAAATMKKRFQALGKGIEAPFFGTFHGLFYKLLIRHYGNIKILEPSQGYRVISNTLANLIDEVSEDKIKEIRNRISLFKCSGRSADDLDKSLTQDIFMNCYNAYEQHKTERGLLDFDDLQIRFMELLKSRTDIAEAYRKGFSYIIVDEFQDSDEVQLQIIKELNKYNSVFAVGDEDQCIYSFRGSRPDYMVDFNKHFKEGIKLQLSTNYRSPENVVGIAATLIKNNLMRNQKAMVANNKEKKSIDIIKCYDENSEAEELCLRIDKLKNIGKYDFREFTVLYRTNLESRSLIDAFIRKKIHFKLLDKEYNFFDHFICKDLTAYLKLSIMAEDMDSFKRIINKPFRYISKVSLEKLSSSMIKNNCFDFLMNLSDTPVFQIKNLDKLQKDIHRLNKMSLQSAIQYIITDLMYHDYIKEYSQKYKIQISELEEILEEYKEAASSYNSIISFLAHIEQYGEELQKSLQQSEDEDRVTLSTIHGVKGMEFKNVFIVNCVEEVIPHINSAESDIEEERRLFYVGITRTIHNLFLCIPRNIRGKYKEPSRFIDECNINLFEDIQALYKIGSAVEHSSFGKGVVVNIDKNVIEIKFENNCLRKFDMIILHNNGIIKKLC